MREKLIELLMDMPFGNSTYEEEERHMEAVADYLLDNGVTVQQWIPVSERLPEKYNTEVIVCTDKGDVMTANYEKDYFINTEAWITPTVTHWMPLPEPPKEG